MRGKLRHRAGIRATFRMRRANGPGRLPPFAALCTLRIDLALPAGTDPATAPVAILGTRASVR